ncbi:MAG: hypothetical protein ACLQLC_02020 [Candidatus Sulfotelmatobacter sp.]
MKHSMRDLVGALLLLGVIAIGSRSWAQAPASLVVTCDMDCNWKLGGVEQSGLSADGTTVIKTIVGEHLIQATSLDGQAKWQGTVSADSSAQRVVKIPLLPFWTDAVTYLGEERQRQRRNGGPSQRVPSKSEAGRAVRLAPAHD